MQIENSTFEYYMNDLRELFDDPTLTRFSQIPTCVRYLKDQLEAAQKDAARIDWMETQGRVCIERVREGHINGAIRHDVEFGYEDNIAKSKKGMRHAIDAAMSSQA